ncbi:hypothetical protein E2974_12440 [Paracoccus yeei]|uniref:ParB/RepB/Spo0J family partition protein n=1 Tax=Paracoccus yeei TaxID=147645 RepID=UPI003BF7F628
MTTFNIHPEGSEPFTPVSAGRSPDKGHLINHRRESVISGPPHDYANLFPMLDASGQDDLRRDIQQHGIREPVILFNGRILDGRNRYMAARDLGLDFPVADFDGTDADARAYVLSTNLHRRHLTESQRAVVAAKLADMKQGERTDLHPSANLPKVSQSDAADMMSVSERSVTTAKKVIEQGAPELVAAVEQGAVSVSAAAIMSDLPQDEQAAAVAEGPRAVKAKAKAVREKKSKTNQAEAPEPETDPETVSVIRELAKLTPSGVAMAVMELRNALADAKANDKQQRKEIDALKSEIAAHQQDDLGRALGNQKRRADAAEGRAREHQANAARLQHQVNKLKEENARLKREIENQVVPL